MNHPDGERQLLDRYEQFCQVALPLYVKEGKSQLTIAVGCTGGKHAPLLLRARSRSTAHPSATSRVSSTAMPCADQN